MPIVGKSSTVKVYVRNLQKVVGKIEYEDATVIHDPCSKTQQRGKCDGKKLKAGERMPWREESQKNKATSVIQKPLAQMSVKIFRK